MKVIHPDFTPCTYKKQVVRVQFSFCPLEPVKCLGKEAFGASQQDVLEQFLSHASDRPKCTERELHKHSAPLPLFKGVETGCTDTKNKSHTIFSVCRSNAMMFKQIC